MCLIEEVTTRHVSLIEGVMEKYVPIRDDVLRLLGDGSVARVGGTCKMLYLTARDELKSRARHYLESDNFWKHGFYPVQGYYGIWEYGTGDGDRNGSTERVLWIRCACELHGHKWKSFHREKCSCELNGTSRVREECTKKLAGGRCYLKLFGPRWAGSCYVGGVMYTRKNESSPVESMGKGKRRVQMWELEQDDKAMVYATRERMPWRVPELLGQ